MPILDQLIREWNQPLGDISDKSIDRNFQRFVQKWQTFLNHAKEQF